MAEPSNTEQTIHPVYGGDVLSSLFFFYAMLCRLGTLFLSLLTGGINKINRRDEIKMSNRPLFPSPSAPIVLLFPAQRFFLFRVPFFMAISHYFFQ